MKISRQTVDKLGVKLYDRASAVVAELIANSFDSDAENVRVRVPLRSLLRTSDASNDSEYDFEIIDDGHGMEPTEANTNFLVVGKDRRKGSGQGAESREKKRRVMGRKGIGKLAPFGICRQIEVISCGGSETSRGYLTSHFIMEYDEIIKDTSDNYYPVAGLKHKTYSKKRGTIIRLSEFLSKRVPDQETFLRQLARRFGTMPNDFSIIVEDTRNPQQNPPTEVKPTDIPIVDSTKIDLASRPVLLEDGSELPVQGWVAMAKESYKDTESAGVRIYARNKIVATTRDFGLVSGYTGEFTLKSYLVGEISAEWIDDDNGEDLIRTDRQDILWESEFGQALSRWGQELLKEVGQKSRQPRREKVGQRFMDIVQIKERAEERFSDSRVVETAVDLGRTIGGFAAEDELEDQVYIDGLSEIILSVAPHRALIDAFREFNAQIAAEKATLDSLIDLFSTTRIAELASYSQIASERVTALQNLEDFINRDAQEYKLQEIIASAPWLIDPTWNVVTANEELKTFADRMRQYWKKNYNEDLEIAIDHQSSKPDFTAVGVRSQLNVIEIKRPGHAFNSRDFERFQKYVQAFRKLFTTTDSIASDFPNGWKILLVCDKINISDDTKSEAMSSYRSKNEVEHIKWVDFLTKSQRANSEFLRVHREAKRKVSQLESSQETIDS